MSGGDEGGGALSKARVSSEISKEQKRARVVYSTSLCSKPVCGLLILYEMTDVKDSFNSQKGQNTDEHTEITKSRKSAYAWNSWQFLIYAFINDVSRKERSLKDRCMANLSFLRYDNAQREAYIDHDTCLERTHQAYIFTLEEMSTPRRSPGRKTAGTNRCRAPCRCPCRTWCRRPSHCHRASRA